MKLFDSGLKKKNNNTLTVELYVLYTLNTYAKFVLIGYYILYYL